MRCIHEIIDINIQTNPEAIIGLMHMAIQLQIQHIRQHVVIIPPQAIKSLNTFMNSLRVSPEGKGLSEWALLRGSIGWVV